MDRLLPFTRWVLILVSEMGGLSVGLLSERRRSLIASIEADVDVTVCSVHDWK